MLRGTPPPLKPPPFRIASKLDDSIDRQQTPLKRVASKTHYAFGIAIWLRRVCVVLCSLAANTAVPICVRVTHTC